jgi:hypothetical protein
MDQDFGKGNTFAINTKYNNPKKNKKINLKKISLHCQAAE